MDPTGIWQPVGHEGESAPWPTKLVARVWYWRKFAVTVTGLLGMVKVHGVEVAPFEQEAPVMFQPANDQLGAGLAATLMACPIGSGHPDRHAGLIVPSPTSVVVRVAEGPRIVSWTF